MKRLMSILFAFLLIVASANSFAVDKTKIAVASDGNTPASAVGPVAGRSSYYLIFDGKGAFVEALSNPHKDAPGGAGSLAVNFLAGKSVTVIVANKFGDKMIGDMKAKGITHVVFKGNARDAVSQIVKGK